MKSHIRLGRIFGIEIGLHYSWFLIAFLIASSLGAHFGASHPDWSASAVWGTAAVTAVLFFVALLAHELSHALVAKSRGLPVRAITLFALGGVAQISKEATSAALEFWMALAGPAASVLIGAGCLGLATAAGWSWGTEAGTPLVALLVWLGYINLLLAGFNMIPGFPLDGGRVLRGIIWWATGDPLRAMRTATRIGRGVALVFIVLGLLRFFVGGDLGGLWLAFIGWFLHEAAQASLVQMETLNALDGVRVQDVMARDCLRLPATMPLQQFVDDELLRTGRRCFIVEEGGRLVGLITPADVRRIDRSEWNRLRVGDAMRPLAELRSVTPETPAREGLEILGREDLNQLPVVSDGRVEGVLSRGNILQLLQARSELTV